MEKNDTEKKEEIETMEWIVPEYELHHRTKLWYLIAISTTLILLIFSFLTANFLFALIIIIISLIIILREGQEPTAIKIILSDEGVAIGKKFYDYDEFKNFAIVYKLSLDIKKLYFDFHNEFRPRLSIPLHQINPLTIRKILLKYLPEDLERINQPTSEELARLFKL